MFSTGGILHIVGGNLEYYGGVHFHGEFQYRGGIISGVGNVHYPYNFEILYCRGYHDRCVGISSVPYGKFSTLNTPQNTQDNLDSTEDIPQGYPVSHTLSGVLL